MNVINDGGRVWILGFKSEYPTTLIETKNSGRTELLGGLTVTIRPVIAPAFINSNSSVTVAGFGEARPRSTNNVYIHSTKSLKMSGFYKPLLRPLDLALIILKLRYSIKNYS